MVFPSDNVERFIELEPERSEFVDADINHLGVERGQCRTVRV